MVQDSKKLIKVDGDFYPCCKRYYYYSMHSLKCQFENHIPEYEDIHYAEINEQRKNTNS